MTEDVDLSKPNIQVGMSPSGVQIILAEGETRLEANLSPIDALRIGAMIQALGTTHITMMEMTRAAMMAAEQAERDKILQQITGPNHKGIILP